jgi:hypothetical protein
MKGWNLVALRGLPFLPCFAVGGERLQFCAIVRSASGALVLEDASDIFNLRVELDRLRIVRVTFNMFRVLVALRRRMPAKVPPLYTAQARSDGTSITIMDDHVLKVCWPAPAEVYACLEEGSSTALPCSIRIKSNVVPPGGNGVTHLKIQPVCTDMLPDSEVNLQRAVMCVLRALAAFHARGFVHRDVRWPNLLRDPNCGDYLLSDFELASRHGTCLPPRFHGLQSFPPETRSSGAYTAPGDVWHVGQLVRAWASTPYEISPAAGAFAALLTADDPEARPTAQNALGDAWLRLPLAN